mgnify:FL=1|jgi:hypothetical protein
MKIEKIIEKILEINPGMKRENLIRRLDGNIEYICEHEVGHPVYSPTEDYIHGCEGCCKDYRILSFENLKD